MGMAGTFMDVIRDLENRVASIQTKELASAIKRVKVATTANIADMAADLAPNKVIDGVTLAAGDRVLVKDQTSAWLNGIYVVTATAPVRAEDATAAILPGTFVIVQGGTAGALKLYQCSAADFTKNTGAVTFGEKAFST